MLGNAFLRSTDHSLAKSGATSSRTKKKKSTFATSSRAVPPFSSTLVPASNTAFAELAS